ncbi:MAG: UPF0182 family protein [Phycicoccus sp.]|nr:UPF0182 family protein [Phycicoccus sp.]
MSDPDWFDEEPSEERGARPREATRPARSRSVFGPTIIIIALLFVVGSAGAGWVTDLWWYESVGFEDVFLREWGTKALLFIGGFVLVAGTLAANLYLAYRSRPFVVPTTPGQQTLEQYRQVLHPVRRLALIAIPSVLGLLAGMGAAGTWQTFLLWRNAVPFGKTDAQFGIDIGFFVFTLPWIRFLVSLVTLVLVLALAASLFTHYLYGGFQLPGRGETTRAAFIQVGVLAALLAIVRGAAYWLDRYSLTTNDGTLMTGVTYTGANAVLPTRAILAVASVMIAGFFLASIWTRSWRLPIIGAVLLLVTAVLMGGIYPALVQAIKVQPSQKSLESQYLGRNIAATRDAYGLSDIDTATYSAVTDAEAGQLRQDADTIPGIRLIDPNVVKNSFRQFEGLREYYAFPDTLDVDRYDVDGVSSDAVVAVRELNLDGVPAAQRGWVNDHTVYTHGYGFVGAYGNQRTAEGDPVFFSGGFTDSGALPEYEPRVYFGEFSPQYSIVGAEEGAEPREFDYPADEGTGGQVNNTYAGGGGVDISSWWRKTAYAVSYREPKFLLSDQVNSQSRILDHRTPRERVERVAPWLSLDGNAYPAVVDGRIQWILDGYTMSARYPNSQLTDLANATSDSVSESSRVVTIGAGQVNYVRNAVKATVDAFDGSVKVYGWDTEDPLLKAWSGAFPGAVRPISEISSQLMSHLRYPQDLLKVQRQLLAKYHVTDPGSFYGGQDFWRVPKDPTHATQDQPTYYQSLAMPDQDAPAFSLTTTFIPTGSGREILRAFLAVDADAGDQAGAPSAEYGRMRLLVLPQTAAVDGPGQIENLIKISTERSQSPTEPLNLAQWITQSSQSGKELTYGNLLTLPVGGGLLYVQPLYVAATREGGSFPQVKVVVAVFGKKVAWGETLDQALDGLFGGNSGAVPGDAEFPETPQSPDGDGTDANQTPLTALGQAIADIEKANADGQAALKAGDFAAYGEAQQRLDEAVARAVRLGAQVAPPAEPDPSASPSPSP